MRRWSLSAASYGALFGMLLGIPIALSFGLSLWLEGPKISIASAGLAERQVAAVAEVEVSLGRIDAAFATLDRIKNPSMLVGIYEQLVDWLEENPSPELQGKLDSRLQTLLNSGELESRIEEAVRAEFQLFDELDFVSTEHNLSMQLFNLHMRLGNTEAAESALAKAKDAAFRFQNEWSIDRILYEDSKQGGVWSVVSLSAVWPVCLALVGFIAAGIASPLIEAFSKSIFGRVLAEKMGSHDFRKALGLDPTAGGDSSSTGSTPKG